MRTANVDLDDPSVTNSRIDILQSKRFLNLIYREWYRELVDEIPSGHGDVLEIGSGAGFLDVFVQGLITSDILPVRNVRLVFDACNEIPVATGSLKAIVMVNVFHHLPRAREFLRHAAAALRPGGRVLMIEPWKTRWSTLIYRNIHHEPFDAQSKSWDFESSGPLSGANGALPWIVFARDHMVFTASFPEFSIRIVRPLMPISYLLSGGFTGPSLVPPFAYRACRMVEKLTGLDRRAGLFALISIEKRNEK